MFKSLKEIKHFLGDRTWKLSYVCVLLGICWFGVETLFVFVMQGFLRSLGLTEGIRTQLPDFYPTGLFESMLVMIAFGFCRFLVLYHKHYFNGAASQAFIAHHRKNVFEYGLRQASHISSSNISTVFNDVILKSGNVIQVSASFIINVTSSLLFLLYGLYIAPIELLIGLGLVLLFNFPLRFLNKQIKHYGGQLLSKTKETNQILLNGIRNHFLLKIYNFTNPEIEKAFSQIDEYENTYKKYYRIHGFKTAFPLFIGIVVISIISYISLKYVHTNGMVLLSFLYIFLRFVQSVSDSISSLVTLRLNQDAFEDLRDIQRKVEAVRAQKAPVIQYRPEAEFHHQDGFSICIEDLTFSFAGRGRIFDKLCLNINKNDIFLIKGESGSGKSTLISLILGILEPEKGGVSISGLKVDQTISRIYNYVGYVGPDPFLVPGTLKENLLLGHPSPESVDLKKMDEYMSILKLGSVLDRPERYDTYLNETAQLSTGQKQRISFARALLREPKLLVLDEATANLDYETEKVIIENIVKNRDKMTVLIVSHKNSFDRFANQIYVTDSRP